MKLSDTCKMNVTLEILSGVSSPISRPSRAPTKKYTPPLTTTTSVLGLLIPNHVSTTDLAWIEFPKKSSMIAWHPLNERTTVPPAAHTNYHWFKKAKAMASQKQIYQFMELGHVGVCNLSERHSRVSLRYSFTSDHIRTYFQLPTGPLLRSQTGLA